MEKRPPKNTNNNIINLVETLAMKAEPDVNN